MILNAMQRPSSLILTPYKPDGIYALGETVGWHVTLKQTPDTLLEAGSARYGYCIKKNNQEVLDNGWLDMSMPARIEIVMDEPAMLFVEVGSMDDDESIVTVGAAVAPHLLQPSVAEPEDFDEFWSRKIAMLRAHPALPELTVKSCDVPEVEHHTLRMKLFDGKHVHGQVARPAHAGKCPGLVYFQWAGGPYRLEPRIVIDYARRGWLVVNIQPHDVLPDASQEYYDSLPDEIKNYHAAGGDDRETSYYLQMYLANYRAVEYLASRPDWDGKTLIVRGTSMGGQQSLWAAALHPQVTGVIAHEPVGADSNGSLHGRTTGYPFWFANTPQTLATSLYFDIVNCAARIKVPTLMSIGFIDQIAPPTGLWTAFNQLRGYKEVIPLLDVAHNHEATAEQLAPFERRADQWLEAFLHGHAAEIFVDGDE